MKNQILTFIIGVLVGAIIATVGFYFYSKHTTTNQEFTRGGRQEMFDQDGEFRNPPDMQNRTGGRGGNMELPENLDGNEIPEKPDSNEDSSKTVSEETENNI